MGFLRDLVAEKALLWEGTDEELSEKYKEKLKAAGFWVSAFRKNQETPMCNGNCGTCPMTCAQDEDIPFYEKQKRAQERIINVLNEKKPYEIYDVYVKKSDLERAREFVKEAGLLKSI